MKKLILFTSLLFAMLVTGSNAQQINQITTRCPSPNRTVYSSIILNKTGNIVATPCPTLATVFTGLIDLSAVTGTFDLSSILTLKLQRTITAGGTVGAQTINKPNGSVNVGVGVGSIVITNSTVTTSSLINAIANTNDATCSVKNAVPTSNTITITMTANCTAETRVAFWVWN
jgi:hypothetical protein